jgi:nicotinamidase-related amidase
VVDYQNAYTQPDAPMGMRRDSEIADDAGPPRRRSVGRSPLYFAAVAYSDSDLAAGRDVWLRKHPRLAELRLGTSAVEVDERLGRRPEEPVIVKSYASAFFATDLATRLRGRRLDTLLVAGCNTGGCVRATGVDPIQHGFLPFVVKGAVGDSGDASHRQALADLQSKYAEIVSLAVAMDYLASTVNRAANPAASEPSLPAPTPSR